MLKGVPLRKPIIKGTRLSCLSCSLRDGPLKKYGESSSVGEGRYSRRIKNAAELLKEGFSILKKVDKLGF